MPLKCFKYVFSSIQLLYNQNLGAATAAEISLYLLANLQSSELSIGLSLDYITNCRLLRIQTLEV